MYSINSMKHGDAVLHRGIVYHMHLVIIICVAIQSAYNDTSITKLNTVYLYIVVLRYVDLLSTKRHNNI